MKYIQHHTGKFFNSGSLMMQYGTACPELIERLNLKEFHDVLDEISPEDLAVTVDANRLLEEEMVISDVTYNQRKDIYERTMTIDRAKRMINHDFITALLERVEALEAQVNTP